MGKTENLWTELKNEDVLDTMRLLGCEQKYLRGEAADFECLCRWLSSFYLLKGNEVAEQYVKKMAEILDKKITFDDVANADASELWREYNTKKYGVEFCNNIFATVYPKNENSNVNNCVEKEIKLTDIFDLTKIVNASDRDFENICKKLENIAENSIHIKLKKGPYIRPDRYKAECALKNVDCDGKYHNETENNILLSQLVLEVVFDKKCEKIQLYVDVTEGLEYAKGFIKYLSDRGHFLRIFLIVATDTPTHEVRDICLLSDEHCFVTPMITFACFESGDVYKKELARIYPCGLIGRFSLES